MYFLKKDVSILQKDKQFQWVKVWDQKQQDWKISQSSTAKECESGRKP